MNIEEEIKNDPELDKKLQEEWLKDNEIKICPAQKDYYGVFDEEKLFQFKKRYNRDRGLS